MVFVDDKLSTHFCKQIPGFLETHFYFVFLVWEISSQTKTKQTEKKATLRSLEQHYWNCVT